MSTRRRNRSALMCWTEQQRCRWRLATVAGWQRWLAGNGGQLGDRGLQVGAGAATEDVQA
ncbi:MAG: hypothetical protein H5T78_25065, partial [Nocardia sp.]|nr:hypothetical protein [Nocardia sp.]